MLLEISKKLTLLTILLESDSAKKEISGFRLALLKGLQGSLEETAELISDTGLVDDLGIMPSPLEQMKEFRAHLDDSAGLEDDIA